MHCLDYIAIQAPCLVLADNDIVACALRVVQEQGTGAAAPRSFPPNPPTTVLFSHQPAILFPCCLPFAFEPHYISLILHPLNADMTAWVTSTKFGITLMNRAVGFLQHASGCAAGAVVLRLMGAHSALLPVSSLPDDNGHTANNALICLINVLGNQEARIKGQDSPIMLIRPDVVGVGNAPRACQ